MKKEKQKFQIYDKVYYIDYNGSIKESYIVGVCVHLGEIYYETNNGDAFDKADMKENYFKTKEKAEKYKDMYY